MTLQYALLLIGIVIIAVVALTAFDTARLQRRRGRPGPQPEVDLSGFPENAQALRSEILKVTRAAGHEKLLRPDAEVALAEKPRDEILRKEIREIEQVATMPLRLDPGIQRRRRARAEPDRQYLPDEKIDFVIDLPGTEACARDTALGIFKQHEYVLNKPRHLYGRHAGTARWSELQLDPATAQYDDLKLAIQLADPHGPIDDSELNRFMQLGLKLADALHRPTKLAQTFEQGLARACELQQFGDTYDVVAAIHVVPKDGVAFPGRAIEMAARHAGLAFGALNLFHMNNDVAPGSRHLYSLANLSEPVAFDPAAWERLQSPGLTLFMSVPCVYLPGPVFEKMVATARELADALGGQLQDQNRRPLTPKGIAVIRHQIDEIEEKMRAFGIAPGSETALKLFSEAAAP
jgi:cell division protein ZipA